MIFTSQRLLILCTLIFNTTLMHGGARGCGLPVRAPLNTPRLINYIENPESYDEDAVKSHISGYNFIMLDHENKIIKSPSEFFKWGEEIIHKVTGASYWLMPYNDSMSNPMIAIYTLPYRDDQEKETFEKNNLALIARLQKKETKK